MKSNLMLALLNLYFYTLFVCITGLLVPLLVLVVTVQAPFIPHRLVMRRFRHMIKIYGRAIIFSGYPWIKVRYENLGIRLSGPAIFACSHRSASDPFLPAYFPGEIVQVVNSWPMKLPVLGFFARTAGYLAVNDIDRDDFFMRARRYLEDGVSILGFPEGTRATTLELNQFHSALFHLAKTTNTPIIPVCICGNEKIPRKGSPTVHPGIIRIRLLPALPPEDFKNLNAFQLKQQVRNLIQAELRIMDAIQP